MANFFGYKNQLWKQIQRFEYTGSAEPFTLDSGRYLVMCNGAIGGKSDVTPSSIRSLGGFSCGVLTLSESKTMYAYVGGNGGDSPADKTIPGSGGWNGGGNGGLSYNAGYTSGPGGGGATDIRLIRTEDISDSDIIPSLPDEYEYVECIQSSGSQYIDTGIPVAGDIGFDIKFYTLNQYGSSNYGAIFGARASSSSREIQITTYLQSSSYSGTFRLGSSSYDALLVKNAINHCVYNTAGDYYVNDCLKRTVAHPSFTYTSNIVLFALRSGTSVTQHGTVRIYYCKLYKAGSLVRDFVPCKRISDNELGMYDLVSETFFTTPTTAKFTIPDIPSDISNEKETRSLKTRFIVAGGGGGSHNFGSNTNSGITTPNYANFGGGIVGGAMVNYNLSSYHNKYASQTDGNAFGKGGVPATHTTASSSYGGEGGGGGGGGWYGGHAIQASSGTYISGPGGGGSGYVYTSSSIIPPGYNVPSDFQLTDTYLSGNKSSEPSIVICELSSTDELDTGDVIHFLPMNESTTLTLDVGMYRLKCWGTSGGCRFNINDTSKGGYSEGTLTLSGPETFRVFVGGSGIGDNLVSATYTHQAIPELTFNGGGQPVVYGGGLTGHSGSAGGGSSDIRIITGLGENETDELSLLSRIIVAGSGGGMGAYAGGDGGGETGGNPLGTNGTNSGPGTQSESPQSESYPTINGGFGYGGNATSSGNGSTSGYAGGAGGSGWYGGSGTYRVTSDTNKGGAGGSGYVLTDSSYKPTGYRINDPLLYLTDAFTTIGASTQPNGNGKVEIEVVDRSTISILCRDSDGVKYFDALMNRWVYVSNTLTMSLFENYGTNRFINDNGLRDDYEILVYDPSESVDTMLMNVVPTPQHIVSSTLTNVEPNRQIFDTIYDPAVYDVSFDVTTEPRGPVSLVTTDLTITKNIQSSKEAKIYSAIYFSK